MPPQKLLPPISAMAPESALALAKARLLFHKPFYGHMLAGVRPREAPNLKAGLATTMDEGGEFALLYNPQRWIMPDTPLRPNGERMRLSELAPQDRQAVKARREVPWTVVELAAGVEHEVRHMVNLHHARGRGLDEATWGLAADEAINQGLSHLPSFAIDHRTYGHAAGLAAEGYYALHDRAKKDRQSPQGNGRGGQAPTPPKPKPNQDPHSRGDQDPPGQPDSRPSCDCTAWQSVPAQSARYKRRVAMAAIRARNLSKGHSSQPGLLPAELEEEIRSLGRRAQDWRAFLRRWGRRHAPIGLRGTPMRPHRRCGWDQPGYRLRLKSTFIVLVDTSGSVGRRELEQFFAELNGMAQWADIIVIEVDAKVQRIYKHRRGTPSIKFQGRGGTYFAEAFDLVAGKAKRRIPNAHLLRGAAGVIVLTDGGIFDVPPKNPMGLDVLWAVTPGGRQPGPWGECIRLTIDERSARRP